MRADVISAGVASFQQAQIDALQTVLGTAFDAGQAEVVPAPVIGVITQDQEDAAIKAVKDADAVLLTAANSQVQDALTQVAGLQQQLADVTADDAKNKGAVQSLASVLDQAQTALNNLKAIIFPAPVVAPAPVVVAPVDPTAPAVPAAPATPADPSAPVAPAAT